MPIIGVLWQEKDPIYSPQTTLDKIKSIEYNVAQKVDFNLEATLLIKGMLGNPSYSYLNNLRVQLPFIRRAGIVI